MYKMNAQILKMLKDNNWLPLTQNILEDLFANPEYPVILEQYFRKFQYLAKITNNLGKLDIEKIIQLEGLLAEFYSILAKNSVGSTAEDESKYLDQKSSMLQEVSNGLKANHDFNAENYRQMFFLDEVINYIKFGFSLGIKKSLPFELKSDIELEKSIKIFKDWLNCHNELCDLMKEMENTLFKQFSVEWKKNVFNENKIQKCTTSKNNLTIQGPFDVIISFCEDLTLYDSGNQKMISACLYNTKSDITFKNRTFGFLYSFSQENIIAMSPSDAEASTIFYTKNNTLIQCLLSGRPVYSGSQYLQVIQKHLLPIYDYNEFKRKTIKYNEILLKEEAKPYGMLVFREALTRYGVSIIAYCISHKLSMFVREENGDLKYYSEDSLYNYLKDSINPEQL